MIDLIGLLLGFFEDLKFWKKKKKELPKKIMLDLSTKVFIIAIIIIVLLKLYKYFFN